MQAHRLGILSAFLASLCCVGPVLLAVAGLGSLGLGAFIGANHWYFIAGAVLLLGWAWYAYLRERRRCATDRCEMVGGKATRITLPLATLAVLGFVGLNVYTYAGGKTAQISPVPAVYAQVAIPVEGMTCYTCTVAVEHGLKELEGVQEAKASVPDRMVTVSYDPQKVSVKQMVEAVNKTGYQARLPEKTSG
jgi:copper chaperone CopZ